MSHRGAVAGWSPRSARNALYAVVLRGVFRKPPAFALPRALPWRMLTVGRAHVQLRRWLARQARVVSGTAGDSFVQGILNPPVMGSNPTDPTRKNNNLCGSPAGFVSSGRADVTWDVRDF